MFKTGVGVALLILGITFIRVKAVTQICSPGRSTVVYQFSVEACPFGVLFASPIKAECLRSSSDNDMSGFYENVCESVKFKQDSSKAIQLISRLTDGPLSTLDSCLGNETFQCDVLDIREVQSKQLTEPGDDVLISEEENFDEPEETYIKRNESSLKDQTYRMFQNLVGLEGDGKFITVGNEIDSVHDARRYRRDVTNNTYLEEGPILRITELLTMSFEILAKHCNTTYVKESFGRDARRMFLFLLKETGSTSKIDDVSVDEYSKIKMSLNSCLKEEPVLEIKGQVCQRFSKAKSVKKQNTTLVYQHDEFAYTPSEYDVVIDATWGVTDFVHGLCYGTFREHINFHHLYQRAMERLFNEEITHRWERPQNLELEEIWDHMLSTNTRQTMRNLDVCIQSAYYGTPFIHRLERPLIKFNGTLAAGAEGAPGAPAPARRKRNAKKKKEVEEEEGEEKEEKQPKTAEFTLEEMGLSEAGWCFQTEAEQKKTILEYIDTTCPNSTLRGQFSGTVGASTINYGSDEIFPTSTIPPHSSTYGSNSSDVTPNPSDLPPDTSDKPVSSSPDTSDKPVSSPPDTSDKPVSSPPEKGEDEPLEEETEAPSEGDTTLSPDEE